MRHIGGPEIKKSVLVDASNLLHRAYYASTKYAHTNITKISIDLTHNYLDAIGRSYVPYMVFDGIAQWRRDSFPNYKGKRPNTDVSLREDSSKFSLTYFKKWCLDNNIHIIHSENDEADDCIASFVRMHQEEQVVICSDDKDFWSLLSFPRVVIYRPGADMPDRWVDREKAEDTFKKRYNLKDFNIDGLRLFRALTGDNSDNITGVFRLPKKVACQISNSSDLEAGMKDIDESWRNKISSVKDIVSRNYHIMGFREDLDYRNHLTMSSGVKKLSQIIPMDDWLKDI